MRKLRFVVIVILAVLLLSTFAIAKTRRHHAKAQNAAANPIDKEVKFPELEKELAQWKRVQMPFDKSGLTTRQQQMVAKLVEASHSIEDIFLRQSDPEAVGLMQSLAGSKNDQDQEVLRMLRIMGSRYDLLAENKPFIGTQPMSPDRGFYPTGLTSEQIEQYVKQNPQKKDEIYSSTTIIRRNGDDLSAVP